MIVDIKRSLYFSVGFTMFSTLVSHDIFLGNNHLEIILSIPSGYLPDEHFSVADWPRIAKNTSTVLS